MYPSSDTPRPGRRAVLLGTAGALGALALPAVPASAASPAAPATDWSKAVVDSTMARYTPATLGGWSYTRGLYLYGQYLVYKRLGTPSYLQYIVDWYNRFIAADGTVNRQFTSLDSMRSGQMLPLLHRETGDDRYKKAADTLRAVFRRSPDAYPRTSDGGMWHNTGLVGQLWADGVYMAQPFLALYGATYGGDAFAFDEAAHNLSVYFTRLKADNGLLFHAYDEDGSESWATPPGNHSAHHWARAIGWFGMAAVDILEVLPSGHPGRADLISFVRHLARGYARYQDRATGRWFQIVDQGADPRNWTETSASSMYTFMLSRGVQRGYLPVRYLDNARRGYAGVLAKTSLGADGLANIADISEGTNVGDADYYYNRPRNTNDFHGLGAFLIMNEQLAYPRY